MEEQAFRTRCRVMATTDGPSRWPCGHSRYGASRAGRRACGDGILEPVHGALRRPTQVGRGCELGRCARGTDRTYPRCFLTRTMIHTLYSIRGMVTSPHHLASQAGLSILKEGGTAIEATVAVAAVLSVVYPHMLSIGGDGFWLVGGNHQHPKAIEACGRAGAFVSRELYQGYKEIPTRGRLAVNTVAGAVSGWALALQESARWAPNLPLERILEEAIYLAEHGAPVSYTMGTIPPEVQRQVMESPSFRAAFTPQQTWPAPGTLLRQPELARTLRHLAKRGLDDFYRGDVAKTIASDLAAIGSPLVQEDLGAHYARIRTPLHLATTRGSIFNFPPPTQGLTSLIILGIFDRLPVKKGESWEHVHGMIEASKLAYEVRENICDDEWMPDDLQYCLEPSFLDKMASCVDMTAARRVRAPSGPGDTAWMGVIDGAGRAVSYIQSVFHPFGSAMVLPESGILWQNRGTSFSLDPNHKNTLAPKKKPFHTLNPAMAMGKDGKLITYGTMGAHGQPQFSSAVLSRYLWFDQPLQAAVSAPRWLLDADQVLVERRLPSELLAALEAAGHRVKLLGEYDSLFGHSHAIARRSDGVLEGAVDPRSDGIVAAF